MEDLEREGDWRRQIALRRRGLCGLAGLLGLTARELEPYRRVLERYPFSAVPYYLSLIDWSDPEDPIRIQALPTPDEAGPSAAGHGPDPLEEERHSPLPGLIHRYEDRVLLLAGHMCAVRCRHCNRKRTWRSKEAVLSRSGREAWLEYLGRHPEVREVILSGGDPLLLPDRALEGLLRALRAVPHIEVLRIGTRVPVTLPMRVTHELAALLGRSRPLWVNTQFNHPREVTPEAAQAVERLLLQGIPVSNQTVLLRGVNDSAEVLKELFQSLQRIGVRPYYLFQCEPVEGAAHLRTPLRVGMEIMEELWGRTGGLTIPMFVADLPQGGGKALLMPSHLREYSQGRAVFRTFEGRTVEYEDPLEMEREGPIHGHPKGGSDPEGHRR